MTVELRRQPAVTMMTTVVMTSRWLLLLVATQTGHRCGSLAAVPSLAEQQTLCLSDLHHHQPSPSSSETTTGCTTLWVAKFILCIN